MHEYDKSSKWLIQHHGDAVLRLGGVADLVSWRPLQAEVVQPRQLPDGLIEAVRVGQDSPELFVLELATYPDARLVEQALRDLALVYLDRRALPEVLVVVLHPKGNLRAAGEVELESPRGWSRWRAGWRVIEVWNIPAADLLDAGDVGLFPWIPLSRIEGPPEPVLRACREHIDRFAPPEERENLIAVTQVLASLRYNDPRLLNLLGGREAMIESPVLQELKAEWTAEAIAGAIVAVLTARFGERASGLREAIPTNSGREDLDALLRFAATCPDPESFRARLESGA